MKALMLAGMAIIYVLAQTAGARAEGTMDKINKTGVLRCGYVEYYPGLTKDLKTGEWHGFDYEIIKAVGERLQLEVKHVAQTGWATVVPDLKAGKFDALCSGFWVHPNVGRHALFSRPMFFQPVFVVARADDKRFGKSTNLNDENLKMVALDGDNPVSIAQADFPNAQVLALPNMTDFSQVLVNVADGKADFTIVDANAFGAYERNNKGKLKIVTPDKPIRVYPVSYAFGAGDAALRDAVNAALDEMLLDGTIDRILDKYLEFPNSQYRAVIGYRK